MVSVLLGSLLVCRLSIDVADCRSYEDLSFYFRQQPATNLWTEGIFSRESAGPSLAYVTFDGIQSRRSDYVQKSPRTPFNRPVANIHNQRLRSLQPENTVEDPYIMQF